MEANQMVPEELPIDLIDPDPTQPRKRFERIQDLAAVITSVGVLQPILIRPHPTVEGRWMIIIGERRWRAAQLAGLKTIPVYNRGGAEPAQIFFMQIAENLEIYRDPLEAHEKAVALKAYVGQIGVEAACKQFGREKDWISRETALAEVSDEVWAVAEAEKIQDKRTIIDLNRLCKHTGKAPDEEWKTIKQIGPKSREALHTRLASSGAKKPRVKKDADAEATADAAGAQDSSVETAAGKPLQITPQDRSTPATVSSSETGQGAQPGRYKRKGLATMMRKASEVIGINSEIDFEAFLEELLKRAVPEVKEFSEAVAA